MIVLGRLLLLDTPSSPTWRAIESAQNEIRMLAFLRWLHVLARKEHVLRTNYHRSHPHFLIYLAADAIITVSLVATGFHYFGPQNWTQHERFMLNHPGIVPAPVDKFLDYMTREEEGIFWIGPREGNKYTVETVNHKFHRISYFLKNAYSTPLDQPQLTVTTYINQRTFLQDVRILLGSQTEKRLLSGGNTIEFVAKSPKSAVITFPTRSQIVAIDFQTTESKEALLAAADKLKEIG